MNNFNLKTFIESNKGRIYEKGVPLTSQEIATVHLKTKSIEDVSKELKLDKRTVKKYSNGNSFYGIGGNFKYNDEVIQYIKEKVIEYPSIYLKELKSKIENDLQISTSLSSLSRILKNNLGFTKKKVIKVCYYRTTPRVQC